MTFSCSLEFDLMHDNKKSWGFLNPPKDLHQLYFFESKACPKVTSLITVAHKSILQFSSCPSLEDMTLCQFISFCIIQSILSLLLQFHCFLHLQLLHFYNPTTTYAWFHSEHLHISILRMCVRLRIHSSIFLLANIYVLICLQARLEFSMSITPPKLLLHKRCIFISY